MKKKNRNQPKKVKRNQRTKLKKKLGRVKLNSKLVSLGKGLHLETFGKVSSFVNKRGSVPSTDTEMFGCEIVRDLPEYVYDFINQIGFDVVISVPILNHNGLTGSGEIGECHTNSRMMSLSIGGNRILGYVLQIMKHQKDVCFIHGHSVWNTPEGKTRCCTDYNSAFEKQGRKRDDFRTELLYGDTLLFVPVGMNDVDKDYNFCLDNFIIYKDDDSFCLRYTRGTPLEVMRNQERYVVMRKELETRLENRGHIFSKYIYQKRTESNLLEMIKSSSFGKVSLFTGRSWDFYKNEMVNIIQNNTPSKSPKWGGIIPQLDMKWG